MARAKRSYGFGVTLVVCAALGSASVSVAAVVTPLAARTGFDAKRGIVMLQCRGDGASTWRISHGAVIDLDLGGADRDVILTTAHGLSQRPDALRRDCRILGAGRRAYRIEAAWRPMGDAFDTSHDWAVLLVSRRLKGDVVRLKPGQVTVDGMLRLAAQRVPVRFVSRNSDLPQRDCNLLPIDEATLGAQPDGLIMLYSCRGAPGLSGSPIVASVDGRPLLIGIHVGWGFRWLGGRLSVVSLGHAVDAQIAAALAKAAVRARE
ncbi:MAG TPA: hypothetical protein VFJ95_10265 [Gammaproteobacteria bacterium]|nr:hypothetical protein [Gammaproteobacteria bacterium]